MSNTTKGYKAALFLKSDDFGLDDLAKWPHAVKSSGGYILRLGKNKKYFVHQSSRDDYLCLETDDTDTQPSAIIDIRGYARGMQKQLNHATLDTEKAVNLMQSLEDDKLLAAEGKFQIFYGNPAPFGKRKIRTTTAYNIRNTAEVRTVLRRNGNWIVRGMHVSLLEGSQRHYGQVFFDRSPTAKVRKLSPVDDDLHDELANRLVKLL